MKRSTRIRKECRERVTPFVGRKIKGYALTERSLTLYFDNGSFTFRDDGLAQFDGDFSFEMKTSTKRLIGQTFEGFKMGNVLGDGSSVGYNAFITTTDRRYVLETALFHWANGAYIRPTVYCDIKDGGRHGR